MLKIALFNKLDIYWSERVTQALGDIDHMPFKSMIKEITATLEITYPESTFQAEHPRGMMFTSATWHKMLTCTSLLPRASKSSLRSTP